MWLEVDAASLEVTQSGFVSQPGERFSFFRSASLRPLSSIDELATCEYGQAIEIDKVNRIVRFGRDYLGHYPLLYAVNAGRLLISDEMSEAIAWLKKAGIQPRISEKALALYFSMGYVPQGLTLYEQVHSCENASIYEFRSGLIQRIDIFRPVDDVQNADLSELGHSIESEICALVADGKRVSAWCSGGLDSSIVALLLSKYSSETELLTLSYDDEATRKHGTGEVRFAELMASSCHLPLRYVKLTRETYRRAYYRFCSAHHSPVIDYVVPPKYALAESSSRTAVTGEGGDPLFAGVKNNVFLYMIERFPNLSPGALYALVHERFFRQLDGILRHGEELSQYVVEYLTQQLNRFPGTILRKLLYANSIIKQGGLIFPKNYYAGKQNQVDVRHPLTALSVYNAAFRLPDERKYRYPTGKIALVDLFAGQLPDEIVKRKKSGTRLFLGTYLPFLATQGIGTEALEESGFFKDSFMQMLHHPGTDSSLILPYAVHTLNSWLTQKGGSSHAPSVPHESRSYDQRPVGLAI